MAVAILREAGINNISIDLISGFEMLSDEDWEYNIKEAILLGPQHISAYQMSIEPGSALGAMYKRGEYAGLSDEECEAQYRTLQRLLAEGGYDQYEISNFALHSEDGRYKSKHNSSYWEGVPYLGLGPAAHSYNGYQRLWNGNSVAGYCRHYAEMPIGTTSKGALLEFGGYEVLSAEDVFNESIMLGLRTVAGVSLSSLDQSFLSEVKGEIMRHCRLGNLLKDGDKIRIPSEKLFVSDGIIKDLFI